MFRVLERTCTTTKKWPDGSEDTYIECPKCGYFSGDNWVQCSGACPMPPSPHFNEELLRKHATYLAKKHSYKECPLCAGCNYSTEKRVMAVERSYLPRVEYEVEVNVCNDCSYEGSFDPEKEDKAALDAYREAERLSLGHMLDSIQKNGYSQSYIERVTGLRIGTLRKWLKEGPEPGGHALIRLMFLEPKALLLLD